MTINFEEITFECEGRIHHGYLAWNDENDKLMPGVLVIHEWWGLNDYMKYRVGRLAQAGYCALAVDMYGNGWIAKNPDEAGEVMNGVLGDMKLAGKRLQAGYDSLVGRAQVSDKTAAIGYCFGGAMALHMARTGMPINAAVSFHGALGSFHKASPGEIQAKILVCHGKDDPMVNMDDVESFRLEMDEAKAEYDIEIYEDATHGFSSKEADNNNAKFGLPVGYNVNADRESWASMIALFEKIF